MKFIKRVTAAAAAVLVAAGALSVSAARAVPSSYDKWGTSALGPGYPSVIASYYKIDSLIDFEKNNNSFIFNVSVNGETIPLKLTFPDIGGFRLSTDKTGYFEPKSVQKISYTNDGSAISMSSKDGTKVTFEKKEAVFELNIYNKKNKKLFRITADQIAFGYTRGTLQKLRLELPIASNESIYGTGERFNEFNQVGRRLLMWNVDCGYHGDSTNAELWRGYKNVPLLYSTRGYTLFFNSFYSASADIGYTDKTKYTLDFQGPKFDFYLWTGSADENLYAYTNLTGKAVLYPKWAYQYSAGGGKGVWREGSMYGKAVEVMQKYAELGTPNISAVYVEDIGVDDANVYNVFKKTGTRVFKWNSPDLGLSDMQSALPGVAVSDLPRVKNSKSPTQDSGNFIDFTMSNSVDLLGNYLKKQIGWGMSGGLLDFGELIQPTTLFRGNGMTGYEMHNFFPYWYAKSYSQAMKNVKGNDFIFFSRSGCAGSQKYTANFTGDQMSNFEGMRQQLSAGISSGVSGFAMWGGDLAGYSGLPTNEAFCRGMQLATFEPIMRSHGTTTRFPWDFGNEGIATYKSHYWLRENLLNEIYSGAIIANKTGLPMTKAFAIAYPDDLSLTDVYKSYIFCDDLLVTPVLSAGAYTYNVTFPQGTWYGLWDGSMVKGGSVKAVESPIDRSPVYIRSGATIPLRLSDKLELTDSMLDCDPVDALLVTIPDHNDESYYYKSEKTAVHYTNTIVDSNTFRVSAGEGNDAKALVIKGVAAYSVSVDGKMLTRLTEKPVEGGKVGYYIDGNSTTTVYIGKSDWEKADISLGSLDYSNLMLGAKSEADSWSAASDGNWDTSYRFTNRVGGGDLVYKMNSMSKLGKIVLKWTNDKATAYTVSVSQDGENWKTVATCDDSYGGIESYTVDGIIAQYIKLSDVSWKTGEANARIYEIEAYPGSSKVSESSGSLSDGFSDPDDAGVTTTRTDDVIVTIPGTSNKYIKYTTTEYYFPTWAIVLICVGSVLLVGGITFIIIKKKRKKKACVITGQDVTESQPETENTGTDVDNKE